MMYVLRTVSGGEEFGCSSSSEGRHDIVVVLVIALVEVMEMGDGKAPMDQERYLGYHCDLIYRMFQSGK